MLWLHQSDHQKLLPRTKVGGGWNIYTQITGGSDLNGDGRGDLLATDKDGVLWFYASTGNAAAPFTARQKIGGGWGVYNLLTAPGNIAGASGGDLLARDKDGVLWLYLGKGDGTFTARRQVGGGWQKYTHIIPAGKNGKGVADLYAIGPARLRALLRPRRHDPPLRTGLLPAPAQRLHPLHHLLLIPVSRRPAQQT